MPRYYAIFFNQNIIPILKNEEFRRALGLAIDKNRIINEVLKNKDKKINKAVYDRRSYKYHGKVKAVAEGARAEGLKI